MRALKRFSIILVLIAAACLPTPADAGPDATLALLRQRLSKSVGEIPWNPAEGYALEGRFVLKATGEDITYRARYVRASNRWVADFSREDATRNLRYACSGERAWAGSPEITVDLKPSQLPYMARFDFYQLYDSLLRILEKGTRDPDFAAAAAGNEIHVSGKLPNGWEANFIFNMVEYFPRKVSVTIKEKSSPAWLLLFGKPDGSASLRNVPGLPSEFEIWFSDPVIEDRHRYPQRMDFVENGNVVGTFFLEKNMPIAEAEALWDRPPDLPWAETLSFKPRKDSWPPSAYLNSADLTEFRRRMEQEPWSGWSRENHLIALWAVPAAWLGRIFPYPLSFRLALVTAAMLFVGIFFLLLRRRRQTGAPYRWGILLAGFLASCLILLGWFAARQMHSPQARSRLALHSAIRHAFTGHSFYAARTASLLRNFQREAPARSMEDLGHSCQAYALAYDLVRPALAPDKRVRIAEDLFRYARPLFGASRGWISSTGGSSVISAGLGMAGLVLGYEPYIAAAREMMDKTLASQLVDGLHQSGPGPGSVAMDSAVNLFYGLKYSGRADYYANASFRRYLDATLQLISPVGTLPLFGNTSLDQADRLSAFFLKTANHVSEKEGRECLAAYHRYWSHGRYHAGGWIKWFLPAFQSIGLTFANPHIFLQYTRDLPSSSLRASSAILGDGQYAVLRTGRGPDDAYLALNMTRSADSAHRDILTFDLYALGSLLLHGPGFPGDDHADFKESARTAASNTITFNNEDQASIHSTGIESSLLNQPIFDHVRALADKTYDHGSVQRDIVLARPEKGHPAYFLLFDDVYAPASETSVQWHLHGRGNLAAGIAHSSRWTTTRFEPPRLWPNRIVLEAFYPTGIPGKLTKKSGRLYSQNSLLSRNLESIVIEWAGSKRFCCLLAPRRFKEAQAAIRAPGKGAFRIGATDWVSIGIPGTETAIGPLKHSSEYTIVRDRQSSFPALLMVSGRECRFGPHSLLSSKPVTASLKGLFGGFANPKPDTQVELRTPSIRAGDRFRLDDQIIAAAEPGVLRFLLQSTGNHTLQPD